MRRILPTLTHSRELSHLAVHHHDAGAIMRREVKRSGRTRAGRVGAPAQRRAEAVDQAGRDHVVTS